MPAQGASIHTFSFNKASLMGRLLRTAGAAGVFAEVVSAIVS